MAVLAYVRDNGRSRAIRDLNTEAIGEVSSGGNCLADIYVFGKQIGREMVQGWRHTPKIGVTRSIKVAIKIGVHMAACIVIAHAADPSVRIPCFGTRRSTYVIPDEFPSPTSRWRLNVH